MRLAIFTNFSFFSRRKVSSASYGFLWHTIGRRGPLPFVPNPDEHGTMGINNLGEIVYGYTPNDTFSNIRPFIWLPQSAYGLGAE